jgi:hypothetical protein
MSGRAIAPQSLNRCERQRALYMFLDGVHRQLRCFPIGAQISKKLRIPFLAKLS